MITTELLFGHGCLTWFDDDHKKFKCTTEAQGHHMLPSKKITDFDIKSFDMSIKN